MHCSRLLAGRVGVDADLGLPMMSVAYTANIPDLVAPQERPRVVTILATATGHSLWDTHTSTTLRLHKLLYRLHSRS